MKQTGAFFLLLVLGKSNQTLYQFLSGRLPGTQRGLWDSWPPEPQCHDDEHPGERRECWEHLGGRRDEASE